MSPTSPPGAPSPLSLELPDLPEIQLGAGLSPVELRGQRTAAERWREGLSNAGPLVLMTVLALGSWWLVKNAPQPPEQAPSQVASREPDFRMDDVRIQRFAADGRLKIQVEGRELVHDPVDKGIRLSYGQIQLWQKEGRRTQAQAKEVWSDDANSQMRLQGDAVLSGQTAKGLPLTLAGERLDIDVDGQTLQSDGPVDIRIDEHRIQTSGVFLDSVNERAELRGRTRTVLRPARARGG
jgi:lipopolysaccharide export system protein LptC